MDDRRRWQYLQAMGIDVWLPQKKAVTEFEPLVKYQWVVLLETETTLPDTGILLEELLTAMALDREQVLIMSMTLNSDLIAAIASIQPKMVIVMGEQIAQRLLQTKTAITALRGVKHTLCIGVVSVSVIVSFSLTYLLQTAIDKRLAWQDIQLALNMFNGQVNQETK